MSWISSGIPPRYFRALRSRAEEQPSSSEVLPVRMVPSGISMAAAGSPVRSATARAGDTTDRLRGVRPSCFMSSSILYTAVPSVWPRRWRHSSA